MPVNRTRVAEDQLNLTVDWGEIVGDITAQTDLITYLNQRETNLVSVTTFAGHTSATTNVHGIVNTADLALKSAGITQFEDVSFDVDGINQAIAKMHDQNTDAGTSSASFYIGTGGPLLKNNLGVIELRNSADSDYADLVVNNLTVKGTTTTIDSTELNINDNVITLNSNFDGDTPVINGGIEVERGTQTNASLIWDESNDLWKAGLAGSEKTVVLQGNTVTLTGDVTGSAAFDASGNVSIVTDLDATQHTHALTSLSDVLVTDVVENDALLWDSTASKWVNKPVVADINIGVQKKSFVTAAGQTEFDISDIYSATNFYIAVYRNGVLMLDDLDYVLDTVNKKITFNYTCNLEDLVVVVQFSK